MASNAAVVDLKTGTEAKEVNPTSIRIRPHIAYLDFLKKNRLLEQAIEGTLPKEVERAAKLAVASELVSKHGRDKVRVFSNGMGDIAISVDTDSKALEQEETNDYIQHYKMDKFIRLLDTAAAFRNIDKGQKYEVKSGSYLNRCVLVKGLDTEIFGVEWHENFGHPLSESHVFRVQTDSLPMRGRTFVCKLIDDQRDVLIHESEIGLHII